MVKKLIKILKISFILLYISFFQTIYAETIIISSGEYKPGYSEYAPHYGYVNHIVIEAFKAQGLEVNMAFNPWIRSYRDAKEGNVAIASCCWFLNAERKKDFFISDKVTDNDFVFFHLKSKKFNWNSYKDLRKYRLGIPRGYTLPDGLIDEIKAGNIKVDWSASDEQVLRKLFMGRVDSAVTGIDSGYETKMSVEEMKNLTHHKKILRLSGVYLLFSKKNKESKLLMMKFNKGLKVIRENGKLDEIIINSKAGFYKRLSEKWCPRKL